jgi:hypothetical protein
VLGGWGRRIERGWIMGTKTQLNKMNSWALVAHAIILATQEAGIRRITVQSQSGQIVYETLSRKKPITKNGLVEWLKV